MQANINNSFFIRPLGDRTAAFEPLLHVGDVSFTVVERTKPSNARDVSAQENLKFICYSIYTIWRWIKRLCEAINMHIYQIGY